MAPDPSDAFSELAAADRAANADADSVVVPSGAEKPSLPTAEPLGESANVGAPSADDDAFWQEQEPSGKSKLLRALPMFAIVQVAAVIIILLVVLLRIG